MKSLSIQVISSVEEIAWGLRSYVGEINIGHYKETFDMPVEYWTRRDYEKQWREGIERIETNDRSCLVTRVEGYHNKPVHIEWWLLYKEDYKIVIRNQMLRPTMPSFKIDGPFTPETCYNYIPRKSRNKNVSEWIIDLENESATI